MQQAVARSTQPAHRERQIVPIVMRVQLLTGDFHPAAFAVSGFRDTAIPDCGLQDATSAHLTRGATLLLVSGDPAGLLLCCHAQALTSPRSLNR
jgi:hypothetical protein